MTATVINITDKNIAQMCKLLAMASSDNDGESANAGRLANKLLLTMGVSWLELLTPPEETVNPQVSVGGKPATPPPPPPNGSGNGSAASQSGPAGVQPRKPRYRAGGSARAQYYATHVQPGAHRVAAATILAHHKHKLVNHWDDDFVNDMANTIGDYLTIRQFDQLARICQYCGVTI